MNNYTRTPRASRRNKKNRAARTLLVVCMMLVVMVGSIAGTVAWLTDNTDPVVNTFTTSDVEIELDEDNAVDKKQSFKMVPGATISKRPYATVKAVSEACWLFVKVEEVNVANFLTYAVDSTWGKLDGVDGVYYREVADTEADQVFEILDDNQVTVKSDVTKTQMNALTEATYPQLKFTAYAIQTEGFDTAADAWAEINK